MTDADEHAGRVVKTVAGFIDHTVLALGTRVVATEPDGLRREGTVIAREWWFADLMFYVVRQSGGVPCHVWPGRDVIQTVDSGPADAVS